MGDVLARGEPPALLEVAAVETSDAARASQPQAILNKHLPAIAAAAGRGAAESDYQGTTRGGGNSGLKPAAIQVAAEVPLVEAKPLNEFKPLAVKPAAVAQPIEQPAKGVAAVAKPATNHTAASSQPIVASITNNPFITGTPGKINPSVASAPAKSSPVLASPQVIQPEADDQLPPIVPAWAMPRPGKGATNGRGGQGSGFGVQGSGMTKPEAPLTKDQAASSQPIQNPKSKIQNPPDIRPVDYETRSFAQPPPRPLPARATMWSSASCRKVRRSKRSRQSGKIKLRVRRSILLRTKVDVYRTAIVDEAVCDIVQFTPREVSIIGRAIGQTHVTFWFDDPAMAPLTYVVEVKPDAEQVKADEDKYQLLQNVINEMFPDSKIHLVIVADKLLVKGWPRRADEQRPDAHARRATATYW